MSTKDELYEMFCGAYGVVSARPYHWPDYPARRAPEALSQTPGRSADDSDTITKNIMRIRLYEQHRCFRKHSLSVEQCWCYKAAANGDTIPCSEASPEPATMFDAFVAYDVKIIAGADNAQKTPGCAETLSTSLSISVSPVTDAVGYKFISIAEFDASDIVVIDTPKAEFEERMVQDLWNPPE